MELSKSILKQLRGNKLINSLTYSLLAYVLEFGDFQKQLSSKEIKDFCEDYEVTKLDFLTLLVKLEKKKIGSFDQLSLF